jgi:nitroreductase
MTMDPVLARMRAHRTIRRYTDAPLPDAHVAEAVEAAQCAATSSNIQGYCLLRVRDAETRAALAELTGGQAQVAEAGGFFVVCGDQRRHRLAAADAGRAYEPNLESFLLAVIDASLFAQNLALAFEAQGYGTCYIGGLRTRLPEVDALLDVADDVLPLFGLCVGTAAEDPGRRPRLPLEAVLYEERFPTDDELRAHFAEYDAITERYYAEVRGKSGLTWTGGVSRKFERPLREHLFEYYRGKGARFA